GRWDADGVQLEASATGSGWTLTGDKHYVLDGVIADLMLVVARTPAGVSVFAVPSGAAGFTATALPTLDQTRKQAELTFAGTPARSPGTRPARVPSPRREPGRTAPRPSWRWRPRASRSTAVSGSPGNTPRISTSSAPRARSCSSATRSTSASWSPTGSAPENP